MGSFWTSSGSMKQLAAALIGLAMVGIAAIHYGNQKAVAIQGPGALQVIDDQSVWLGVNQELWVLSSAGHQTGKRSVHQLGLSAAISNIVIAPAGQVLLSSRSDPAWQVVNSHDLSPVRSITPQWPRDFEDKDHAATHIAVSPNWDIAVATGGGHAVLLFDKNGRFIRRTRPDTYYFTNGLWHGPQGWWTTDTNRSALKLLDTETLENLSTIELMDESGGYNALGELIASRGNPRPGRDDRPIGTVSRLGFLMEPGYAVDIFADGKQVVFNREPLPILRDLAWLGRELLIVDGGNYQVLRFDADRTATGRFGDSQVNAALQQMLTDRVFWVLLSNRYAFVIAALLLVLGIAAYVRHKRLLIQTKLNARAASFVGTPRQSLRQLIAQRLWIFGWPISLRFGAAAAGWTFLLPWLMGDATQVDYLSRPLHHFSLVVLSVLLPLYPVAIWQQWRHARLSAKAGYEATLNHAAMNWLDRHDDWDRARQAGESTRETIYLIGWRPRWLLITNHRILLFAAGARERRLVRVWPRDAVASVAQPGYRPTLYWVQVLRNLFWFPPHNLAILFKSGEQLRGRCASAVTAARLTAILQPPAAESDLGEALTMTGPSRPNLQIRRQRRWHEVIASLALPGLGQWLQDRFATGTVQFTAGLLLCMLGWGPVVWAASGPKMHVDMFTKFWALAWWSALAVASALDAFHFSAASSQAGQRGSDLKALRDSQL